MHCWSVALLRGELRQRRERPYQKRCVAAFQRTPGRPLVEQDSQPGRLVSIEIGVRSEGFAKNAEGAGRQTRKRRRVKKIEDEARAAPPLKCEMFGDDDRRLRRLIVLVSLRSASQAHLSWLDRDPPL